MSISRELITTDQQFKDTLMWLQSEEIFAYDTETNGTFNRDKIELVGLSFAAWKDDEIQAAYLPVGHLEGEQLQIDYVLNHLKELFEDSTKAKICHNAKFDEMVLARYGIDVKGEGHDTYVMAWLLSEDGSSKGLKPLTKQHFGYEMETYEDVVSSAPKKRGVDRDYNFARVGLNEALSYAADDAYWTFRLFNKLKEQIEEEHLWDAYDKVERPFSRILRNVEAKGVLVDQNLINRADERLPKLAEEVEASIYEEAGEIFNIGSSKQLGEVLFEKLGIGNNVATTATGNWSTNQKTLKIYADKHKIVENVLRRKKIQKTHSTFVVGIKDFIGKDGRIHPSFNGCGTATGRLSCRAPNLQQIEGDEVEEIKIRNFFIPAPGYKFVVADYSQVELRVMAHFSKDKEMSDAFTRGTGNFHEEVARKMFNVPDSREVSRKEKVVAKTLNFGVGYGRGPTGIAEQLGIAQDCNEYYIKLNKEDPQKVPEVIRQIWDMDASPNKQKLIEWPRCEECAQCFIRNWFKKFEGVGQYKKHVVQEARRTGFVRTLTGRKRRLLPNIQSDDWMVRGGAERQAFNTKIQGSAADIIKLAMIALEVPLAELGAHIIIQIHDELVIETPEEKTKEVLETTQQIMENPLRGKNPLRLPLVVEPTVVDRWGDAK